MLTHDGDWENLPDILKSSWLYVFFDIRSERYCQYSSVETNSRLLQNTYDIIQFLEGQICCPAWYYRIIPACLSMLRFVKRVSVVMWDFGDLWSDQVNQLI
jgi:hypothetical protein